MFTDSHCHLTFPELSSQLPAIREAMRAAQVDRALCICTTLEEFGEVHTLATAHDNFWCSVGVHPDNEGVIEPSVQAVAFFFHEKAWNRVARADAAEPAPATA